MATTSAPTPLGRQRTVLVVAVAAVWLLLLTAVVRLPPDGREHGDPGQFLGRFHPMLVHGPVALLLIVPLMELAALRPRWAHLRAAVGWILAVAVIAAFAAAFDGWLLAWSGGFRGRDITRHMWGGVSLAGISALAAWARSAAVRGRGARGVYAVLIVLTVGVLVWTGHFGGAISHGNGYVTDKMPAPLRGMLGLPAVTPDNMQTPVAAAPAVPPPGRGGPLSIEPSNSSYYRLHVAPLLARSCVSCHRPEKHKAGLRMDSYALLMKGGDDGPVVLPGNPKGSDLVRRVALPQSDDDFMPSDGDKPLTPEEIQMIDHWIAAGAKGG